MAASGPIFSGEKTPPYHPVVLTRPEPGDIDRVSWDQHHRMWIDTPRRIRTYICSVGVEHNRYYRTHWRQGREDWVACFHEVSIP